MTITESLAVAIKGIRADGTLLSLDEAGIRARVIDHILDRLGWGIFNQDEFNREYTVSAGAVDYALLVNGEPKVFIEAKRPSADLAGHQDQLLRYSGIRGVPLAALTNGFKWWLYLPLKEGGAEARRFYEIDISSQDVSATCELLIKFLGKENVYSGDAVRKAEAHLKRLQEDKAIDKALPRAWEELTDGPDELLVDLINERVKGLCEAEGLCGVEAGPERIKGFLEGLGGAAPEKAGGVSNFSVSGQENPTRLHSLAKSNIGQDGGKHKKRPTRIVGFTFYGQEFSVSAGTEAMIKLSEEIYRRHRPEFDKVRTLSGWHTSEEISPTGIPKPIADSGWYVYTNIINETKITRCNKLVRLFGYREEDLSFQVR